MKCVFSFCFSQLSLKFFSGKIIFSWFQQQCNYVETKTECYKSIEEFKNFMNHRKIICDISIECRNSFIMLQGVLKSKEDKIGHYWQMKIRNCMDAMTTSPVESCNKALKYGLHSIHSNMNLETTCGRVLNGADSKNLIKTKWCQKRNATKQPIFARTNQ